MSFFKKLFSMDHPKLLLYFMCAKIYVFLNASLILEMSILHYDKDSLQNNHTFGLPKKSDKFYYVTNCNVLQIKNIYIENNNVMLRGLTLVNPIDYSIN